jgi:hypothetical protein
MRHKKAFLLGISLVVVVLCISFIFSTDRSDQDKSSPSTYSYELTAEYISSKDTDLSVLIVSDDSDISGYKDIFGFGTSFVEYSDNLDFVGSNVVVIVDQDWYQTRDTADINERVCYLLDQGNIILALDDPQLFINNPDLTFSAFSDDAEVYGVYYDLSINEYACLSVSCDNETLSLQKAYCWIDGIISGSIVSATTSEDSMLYKSAYAVYSFNYFDGYGWLNVMTNYYEIEESNSKYDYYLAHYVLQSVPNEGVSTADMCISSNLSNENMQLIDYSPTTVTGLVTADIDLGSIAGTDGNSSDALTHWQYEVRDVEIRDRSNYGTNTFYIWHDVDENAVTGNSIYAVEPGKIVKVFCESDEVAGSYYGIDKYSIQFVCDGDYMLFETTMSMKFAPLS